MEGASLDRGFVATNKVNVPYVDSTCRMVASVSVFARLGERFQMVGADLGVRDGLGYMVFSRCIIGGLLVTYAAYNALEREGGEIAKLNIVRGVIEIVHGVVTGSVHTARLMNINSVATAVLGRALIATGSCFFLIRALQAGINGIKAYKEGSRFDMQLSVSLIAASILGFVSVVVSGGEFLVLGTVSWLVSEVIIASFNVYSFREAATELKQFSWKDRAIIITMMALTILSTIVGYNFAATSIAANTVLVSGALMLGIQLTSLWKGSSRHSCISAFREREMVGCAL